MFAITLKAKRDGKLYEVISPVRIPEGTIVTKENMEPYDKKSEN